MSAPVNAGEILAGKYRVERVLGVGGMGAVVAAHHLQLDEKVALKFLLPDALSNPEAVARFAREARAAVKIKSEHVARVTDVGTLETGAPYMVMEYLEGLDLAVWLKQRGALSIEQACDFMLQACEAIAEAHSLGIVHRDLKPANLFVIRLPDGTLSVKVLDFGISKISGAGGASGADMTRTSALMGTPLYMSPEQMQSSKDADSRADVWALGITLYELLTADSPFAADTMPELIVKILSAPPPTLSTKLADVPDRLQSALSKCLEKDRTRRFQTVGELALALLEFAPKRKASVERILSILRAVGLSASSLAVPPSDATPGPIAHTGTAGSWGRTAGDTPSNKTAIFVGFAALIAIVVAGVIWLKPSSPVAHVDPASPPSTPAPSVAPPPAIETAAGSAELVAPVEATAETSAPVVPAAPSVAPSPQTRPDVAARPASHPRPSSTATVAQKNVDVPVVAPAVQPAPAANDCDPNYYFDAQGEKHFKPKCFLNH